LTTSAPATSALRKFVFYSLTVLLILLTIVNSWGVIDYLHKNPSTGPAQKIQSEPPDLEAQFLESQAKIVIGALDFFDKNSINQNPENMKKLASMVKKEYLGGLFGQAGLPKEIYSKMGRASLRIRVILRNWFNLEQGKALKELKRRQDKTISVADQVLIETLENPDSPITEKQRQILSDEMKWLGQLYLSKKDGPGSSNDDFQKSLSSGFKKFVIGALFLSLFAFSSLTIFGLTSIQLLRGKFQSKLVPLERSGHLLEIFCVYLACMLSGSLIIKLLVIHAGLKPDLKIQVPVIVGSLVALLFPLLSGVGFKKIRQDVGLTLDGFGKVFRDVFTTPLLYVGIWTPFFLILLVYASILTALKLDMNQASHPIVPVLTQAPDHFKIALIFFLAVVCAPIIEEIMFRGAFYGWLRSRASVPASVIISSLIFAAVHPQGPIGIVPLTMIGSFLAILREWRGNLLAPMIAHACVNFGTLTMVLFVFR